MTIQLMHGDCLVRMAEIPDGSVDMILADLPYGTTACKWDNVIPFEPLWKHYWRVLKPNGAVVLFGNQPFTTKLIQSAFVHFKYCWIWDKHIPRGFQVAKYRPMSQHEEIAVFSQKPLRYFPQMEQREKPVRYKNYKSSRSATSTDLEDRQTNRTSTHKHPSTLIKGLWEANKGKHHPTQKPVALLEYLIRTYTLEGETVLDNTMGSGSTGVAAVNLSRKFIGIEQDDKYFAIAEKRIAEAQTPKELWS